MVLNFLIKVNALNSNTFKQFYDLLNDSLHSFVKINYKECKGYSNSNDRKSNYNKVKKIQIIKRLIKSFFSMPREFYSC